jgi:hypothetical protein
MARTPKTPAPTAPEAQVDMAQLQIGDLLIFARLATLGSGDEAAATAAMAMAIPMLDRLVVGGVSHRPLAELGPMMEAVAAAMKEVGNPGN